MLHPKPKVVALLPGADIRLRWSEKTQVEISDAPEEKRFRYRDLVAW